jgi:hypothetical protein
VPSLVSGGGAYLIGNADQVKAWPGSADNAAYDSIPFGADEGLVASVVGIPVVVMGLPDPLHVVLTPGGVVFAIAVCCDDDAAVETLEAAAAEKNWSSIGVFTVTGRVVAFDSALAGEEAISHGLQVQLTSGEYTVESRLFSPDPDTELQLVRFRSQ